MTKTMKIVSSVQRQHKYIRVGSSSQGHERAKSISTMMILKLLLELNDA